MDPREIVRAGYNAIGNAYHEARVHDEDSDQVRFLHELEERLPPQAKVLDAGCGAGFPITRILSRLFEVTGVDFAEEQVRLARRLIPRARFLCEDITELSFPDDHFDAICSYYAIIHIPRRNHRRVLVNFNRMLRPGGLALLCMGAGDLVGGIEEDYFGSPMYWSHYDAGTNLRMLGECGFRVLWSKIVDDRTDSPAKHLFALAQKPQKS